MRSKSLKRALLGATVLASMMMAGAAHAALQDRDLGSVDIQGENTAPTY